MQRFRTFLLLSAMAGALGLAPSRAAAQPADAASTTRRAEEEFARLRSELERVNAEIADLKRGSRSMRNDYRLRERMADAEALAQKLTQAEKRLRTLGVPSTSGKGSISPTVPPQALPQDGSVELEAKADLLADQAGRLVKEADVLATAAAELRNRKALRRRAGAWDRDPFTGLESSKRNLAISPGSAPPPGPQRSDLPKSNGAENSDSSTRGASSVMLPAPVAPYDSAGKSASVATISESGSASKTAPLPTADRQVLDQHFYLDPTTAAELRQALGTGQLLADSDALERAAASLRARARALAAQAQTLRAKSRAP